MIIMMMQITNWYNFVNLLNKKKIHASEKKKKECQWLENEFIL